MAWPSPQGMHHAQGQDEGLVTQEFFPVSLLHLGKGSRLVVTCVGSLARGSLPGEMKKVLHSFLSLVTSRISFVMLTILMATGGTRQKSRILAGKGRGEGLTSVPRPALGW